MTPAQSDIQAIDAWLAASSRLKKAPMSGDVLIGPYATLLVVDPGATDYPNLSSLAVNGFALFAPTQQLAKPRVAHLDMQPEGQPSLVRRIEHLFGYKLGIELPDVLTLALSDPDQSIADHLTAEGLGDIDLDTVACLCVPLWAIPAADRTVFPNSANTRRQSAVCKGCCGPTGRVLGRGLLIWLETFERWRSPITTLSSWRDHAIYQNK